jgi:hypothetical protein
VDPRLMTLFLRCAYSTTVTSFGFDLPRALMIIYSDLSSKGTC